ncbi:MAG TPA: trypsin-like serine protease [Oligoflexus sp.]|uniref:trypsin-like serine protease n=1 Tax=Oligoflexus sp. TaxID=1971216 RepID=UPI002D3DEDBC|nr:trypsin-like serine protease [Oligoflexus sp.]HYX38787.1 trypsin-like serine protease [Oligoflexus sp.]
MKKVSGIVKGAVTLGALGLATACGVSPADRSEVKVTNGREVGETEYPSVVLLYDSVQGGICTGTFITPTVVLSAAHCTMAGKVDADGNVELKLAMIRIKDPVAKQAELIAESTSIIRNPLWDKNGRNVNKYDLSLITFPAGTSQAVSAIASVGAKAKDKFTIVGYGLNQMKDMSNGDSAGVKREGVNAVSSVSGGFIQFTGKDSTTTADGTDVSSASGDSGGPLFINGKVAGVTSGGGWGGFGRTRSMYIDLWSSESQAFLGKHLNLDK